MDTTLSSSQDFSLTAGAAALQRIAVLGSTGSIGKSTLQVVELHPERYAVHTLSGNRNWQVMLEQVRKFKPVIAIMADENSAGQLDAALKKHNRSDGTVETQVRAGADELVAVAGGDQVDVVVAGIVGAAGLPSTLAAANSGKRILLANKEALVMCGELLMTSALKSGALIMPTDSEHNAIFQCLPLEVTESANNVSSKFAESQDTRSVGAYKGIDTSGIEKIVLTASGGPFRGMTKKQLAVVSKQQALQHPSWKMGPKITIDSATLMNKGLEVIEACYLFGVDRSMLEVLVHPQSVIHSMVRYIDGSVIAQLGRPDMRTPIAHCLAWPDRMPSGVEPLDLLGTGSLTFEPPDYDVFPCLKLAFDALQEGQTAATVLNAANEVAVAAFLNDDVSFIQLPMIIEKTLESTKLQTADDLETILIADNTARRIANTMVQNLKRTPSHATLDR